MCAGEAARQVYGAKQFVQYRAFVLRWPSLGSTISRYYSVVYSCNCGHAQLTVRFLVASTGTRTSEFLGLAATGIGDKERAVVADKHVADLLLRSLVDKLLVVRDD